MNTGLLSAAFVGLALASAEAQGVGKFHITPQEQAACQVDATTFCSSVFPDEDALIACMRSNVGNLSPVCRRTFAAGLRKRNM